MKSLKLAFSSSDVHKIRNFGERLSLDLGELGMLPMGEVDVCTDTLIVKRIHTRKLRRCKAFIEKLLYEHHLISECRIVEVKEPGG